MTYDPDRFLPERMADMDSHAYLPFSAGTRICFGRNVGLAQVKTIIAHTLRRFEVSLDPERPEFIPRSFDMGTKPVGEAIYLVLSTRT